MPEDIDRIALVAAARGRRSSLLFLQEDRGGQMPIHLVDEMIAALRRNPDESFVRWRSSQSEWRTSSGSEFLELWDQPAAGTIYVDRVWSLPGVDARAGCAYCAPDEACAVHLG